MLFVFFFFFFKQKTAYEIRKGDWSSDVCSSDLAPILLAPAMNGKMWQHPATIENVEKLKTQGVEFIGPEEGMLACGYEGIGRLWKVNDIAFRAEFLLARQDNLIALDFSSRLGPRASRSIRFVTFRIAHRAKWATRLQTRHSKPGTMSF